jgi:hypothetical protein
MDALYEFGQFGWHGTHPGVDIEACHAIARRLLADVR